jgi:MoaA/NifB/PqqE/SkfB family radical SAM enzyme
MCIKEGSVNWQGRDMKLEDFRKISEYFSKAQNIVLQGWGEPLLYGNLIDAVRIVKEKGARPGFVTSGSALQKKLVSEHIDSGTDFIGFSLAGATAQTHASIRTNSDFELLLENIRFLNAVKKEKRLDKPLIHIVYLMLKDNITEVPALVELAKRIGINDIILTNLIHVNNEWQEGQRVFTCDKGGIEKGYGDILKDTEIRAKELNITLSVPSLSP